MDQRDFLSRLAAAPLPRSPRGQRRVRAEASHLIAVHGPDSQVGQAAQEYLDRLQGGSNDASR